MPLSPAAGRVLGSLVEKELTTPQQYPLTLHALVAACNQTTAREPVLVLDDAGVLAAVDELKGPRLIRSVLPSHGKSVTRYRHVVHEVHGLTPAQTALLAVLLLRGPQTPGELRARTGRMAEFDSVADVQHQLDRMAEGDEPLVRLLPRRPGQKEDRWEQLLAEGYPTGPGTAVGPGAADDPVAGRHPELEARVAELTGEVTALRDQLAELRYSLIELRSELGE